MDIEKFLRRNFNLREGLLVDRGSNGLKLFTAFLMVNFMVLACASDPYVDPIQGHDHHPTTSAFEGGEESFPEEIAEESVIIVPGTTTTLMTSKDIEMIARQYYPRIDKQQAVVKEADLKTLLQFIEDRESIPSSDIRADFTFTTTAFNQAISDFETQTTNLSSEQRTRVYRLFLIHSILDLIRRYDDALTNGVEQILPGYSQFQSDAKAETEADIAEDLEYWKDVLVKQEIKRQIGEMRYWSGVLENSDSGTVKQLLPDAYLAIKELERQIANIKNGPRIEVGGDEVLLSHSQMPSYGPYLYELRNEGRVTAATLFIEINNFCSHPSDNDFETLQDVESYWHDIANLVDIGEATDDQIANRFFVLDKPLRITNAEEIVTTEGGKEQVGWRIPYTTSDVDNSLVPRRVADVFTHLDFEITEKQLALLLNNHVISGNLSIKNPAFSSEDNLVRFDVLSSEVLDSEVKLGELIIQPEYLFQMGDVVPGLSISFKRVGEARRVAVATRVLRHTVSSFSLSDLVQGYPRGSAQSFEDFETAGGRVLEVGDGLVLSNDFRTVVPATLTMLFPELLDPSLPQGVADLYALAMTRQLPNEMRVDGEITFFEGRFKIIATDVVRFGYTFLEVNDITRENWYVVNPDDPDEPLYDVFQSHNITNQRLQIQGDGPLTVPILDQTGRTGLTTVGFVNEDDGSQQQMGGPIQIAGEDFYPVLPLFSVKKDDGTYTTYHLAVEPNDEQNYLDLAPGFQSQIANANPKVAILVLLFRGAKAFGVPLP